MLQKMVCDLDHAKREELDSLLSGMDDDFREMYQIMIESGKSAYGAAKEVKNSGMSTRDFKTLWKHAKIIQRNLLDFLTGINCQTLLSSLKREGQVDCPSELVNEFRKMLKDEGIPAEEYHGFRLITISSSE
jgi:hypothetical protein